MNTYEFRDRKTINLSQTILPRCYLLLLNTGYYAICPIRACKAIKKLESDEYKDRLFVKHGWGNDQVVGEVKREGTEEELREYLHINKLTLHTSDEENKENSPEKSRETISSKL
jgi:hypothetical protein